MGEVWGGLPFFLQSDQRFGGSVAQQQIVKREAETIKPSNRCSHVTTRVGTGGVIFFKGRRIVQWLELLHVLSNLKARCKQCMTATQVIVQSRQQSSGALP